MKSQFIKELLEELERTDVPTIEIIDQDPTLWVNDQSYQFDERHDVQLYIDRNDENLIKIWKLVKDLNDLEIEEL